MKYRIFLYLSIFSFLLLWIRCDTARRDWEQARAGNSIESYQLFIEKHPESPYTERAGRRLESLHYRQARAAGTVQAYEQFLSLYPDGEYADNARLAIKTSRTIRLMVDESYGAAKNFSLNLFSRTEKFLKEIGFTVAGPEKTVFDATLQVEIRGKPVALAYTLTKGPLRQLIRFTKYTGARVEGQMTYTDNHGISQSRKVYAEKRRT